MSSTPLILPRQTPVNGSGRPYPSSTVTVYRAGTTTLATIYSNSARTVPLSNPLTANSAGQFPPIYPDPNYNVRIVHKTSAGVTLSDDDNVGTSPELTADAVGEVLYPVGDSESGVTDLIYPPGDVRRYGATGDGTTDDTESIQAAIDSNSTVYVPGVRAGKSYKFTSLTLKGRTRIYGDGPRASVLRQTGSGVAITLEDGTPPSGYGVDDITEGSHVLENLGIQVSGTTGIKAGAGTLAAMMRTEHLRIQHQHSETLSSAPYTVVAGTRGIDLDGDSGSAIYMANHRNLEIRSFETAVYARNTVNEQNFHGWFLDCKYGFDLDAISTWMLEVTCESGVANARMFKLSGDISNLIVDGGRCELSQATSYMFEFGTVTASNIRVRNPNINISGDGGAWPGGKYTGTLPQDVVFELTRSSDPLVAGSTSTTLTHALPVRLGGTTLGNGKLTFGRNAGSADAIIEHDGTNLVLSAANYVEIGGASGATGYANALKLGSYYLWVASDGKLYIKSSTPGSDTDGTVVGTQS